MSLLAKGLTCSQQRMGKRRPRSNRQSANGPSASPRHQQNRTRKKPHGRHLRRPHPQAGGTARTHGEHFHCPHHPAGWTARCHGQLVGPRPRLRHPTQRWPNRQASLRGAILWAMLASMRCNNCRRPTKRQRPVAKGGKGCTQRRRRGDEKERCPQWAMDLAAKRLGGKGGTQRRRRGGRERGIPSGQWISWRCC